MPRDYKARGLRAAPGSVGSTVLLRLDSLALELARGCAEKAQKPLSEWLRTVIYAAVTEQTR